MNRERRGQRKYKNCRVTGSVCAYTVSVTRPGVCLALRRATGRGGHNCSSECHLLLTAATVARVPALLSSSLLCPTFYSSSFGLSPPRFLSLFSPKGIYPILLLLPLSHHSYFLTHNSFLFSPINLICFFILKRIPAFYSIRFIGVTFNSLYISNASVKF